MKQTDILGKKIIIHHPRIGMVECFVAGADDEIGLSLKALDQENFLQRFVNIFPEMTIEYIRERMAPPRDYVVCILPNVEYDAPFGMRTLPEAIEKIRAWNSEIVLDVSGSGKGVPTRIACPFA